MDRVRNWTWGSQASVQAAFLVTESAVEQLGFETVEWGGFVRYPAPLTSQRGARIADQLFGAGARLSTYYRDVPVDPVDWSLATPYAPWQDSTSSALVQAIVLGAALVLVMLVVAIGLALAATESRDERDVLVAVGARPTTLRRLAGTKAIVMTLTGVAVAIPAGLLPMAIIPRAIDQPFHMPWLTLAGLVLVIPLLAGAGAVLASSLAQRFRPVSMSTLATE